MMDYKRELEKTNVKVKVKNGYAQNVIPTTTEQNIAAAKCCETYNKAVGLFRALQYANNRGTHGGHFDKLETHFINKMGKHEYIKKSLKFKSF